MSFESTTTRFAGQKARPTDLVTKEDLDLLIGILEGEINQSTDAPRLPSSTAARQEAPRVLAGRYELISLIGEGGWGLVWQGFDRELGRPVACKVPKPGRGLLNEARHMAQLDHSAIVKVYDVGCGDQGHWIISELVNGNDLRRHLLAGPLPVQAALRIAAEVASGLQHAHDQGIIHRDVKPANILLDGNGSARLSDFGVACCTQEPGRPCGTLAYSSSEQVAGENVDGRTDVYSLGVVLFELLTGVRPYRGHSTAALQFSICHESPPTLTSINPSLPKEADRIVAKCLAKRRENRYSSAAELAKDLRRLLARLNRRRLSLSVTLVLVTLFLTAYNSYNLYQRRNDPNNWRGGEIEASIVKIIKKVYVDKDGTTALAELENIKPVKQTPLLYLLEGEAHFGLGEYEESINSANSALELYANFWPAMTLKGKAYKQQGNLAEAYKWFEKSLKISNPDAYKQLFPK